MGGCGCRVQGRVLSAHCGSGDGDGFLPLSRVQFKLIRGLTIVTNVRGRVLCDTCLKITSTYYHESVWVMSPGVGN